MQYEIRRTTDEIFMQEKLNLHVTKPIELASSSQKMKGTEKLNNIMRKKQAIHTVRYTREKLVSSTG